MSSERTPLLATVVVVPQRRRPSALRTAITALLSTALIIVVVAFLVPDSWHSHRHRHRHHHDDFLDEPWQPIGNPPIEFSETGLKTGELQKILLDTPNVKHIEQSSRYYTAGPHLAGKNRSQAEYTRDLWQSYGINSKIVSYDCYINYPKSHRVALLRTQSDGGSEVAYEASLEEDVLDEDPTTSLPDRIPTFHGYSANGNVTAQYVFVNFGTKHDFDDLQAAGIDLKGKIAIVKYGRCFRGLKVMLAEQLGMAGVLIYDDPQSDGQTTELNGYKPYPEGWARNPSAVQRGSVQYLSIGPGDPTTIGYPSLPGAERQDPNMTTPSIPSVPISYSDALPLLRALNGHGLSSNDPQFNKYWRGGGLEHLGVQYNIGPSPPELTINLVNEMEFTITPLWDVIGIVNGTRYKDEVVVLGNHRDAWIAGGAGDPNSGSAVINEVIRSYGKALKSGWKPERTMIFGSWDGEEYGLVGSTEWVEEYVPWLKASAVAYLNVDVGSAGSFLSVSAAPLLNSVIKHAAAQVPSPEGSYEGQTIYDAWRDQTGALIRTLGSGSDYTAFMDFAGVSSVDMGYQPDDVNPSPIYHYHSNYDSFHWMTKYGDPGFKYHLAMTRLFGVMAAALVDQPVIPFHAADYTRELGKYVDDAEQKAGAHGAALHGPKPDFEHLKQLVDEIHSLAINLDRKAAILRLQISTGPSWWNKLRGWQPKREIAKVNRAYRLLERSFLYEPGLDGRNWFKHVVFAPGKFTGYAGVTFPGLSEAIDDGDRTGMRKWQGIIRDCLRRAKRVIEEAD